MLVTFDQPSISCAVGVVHTQFIYIHSRYIVRPPFLTFFYLGCTLIKTVDARLFKSFWVWLLKKLNRGGKKKTF